MNNQISLFVDNETKDLGNQIIFILNIVMLVLSIIMIIIGLTQNKKSQTGLTALNGGNDELFANSKERGFEKTLSIWMFSLGGVFFALTIAICIISNTLLK